MSEGLDLYIWMEEKIPDALHRGFAWIFYLASAVVSLGGRVIASFSSK